MISLTGFSTKGNLMPRVGVESDASLVAHIVKKPPAIQETQFRSLSWEDPLEKEMATHSGILVWKIPRTEETGGLQSMRSQRPDMTERLTLTIHHEPVLL